MSGVDERTNLMICCTMWYKKSLSRQSRKRT